MFQIKYALGGGFGGCDNVDWEDCDAKTLQEAEDIAYEMAQQEYDSYAGMHGLRGVETIMEEDELDEEDAEIVYQDEMESWLCYDVREV